MSQTLDEIRIQSFLNEGSEQSIMDFCAYHRNKIEQETNQRHPDLNYDHLRGSELSEKTRNLVEGMKNKGRLAELVFYIIDWWLEQHKGTNRALVQAGMDRELCIAGQDLWDQQHRQAIRAFDYLADIHKDFGEVWKKVRQALENTSSLKPSEEFVNIDQLVTHLRECWELYNQAIKLYENRQFKEARKIFSDLDKLQPHYNDVEQWIIRLDNHLNEHSEICKRLYEQTLKHREQHQWLEARKVFIELSELQSDYEDVAHWMQRLRNQEEVECLQTVINAAESGFIYDDRLPWPGDYPYKLFQKLDNSITPTSSMKSLQDKFGHLEDMSHVEQASLETLTNSETDRLFVDMFLYPVCPSKETALSLEEMFLIEGRLPDQEMINQRYPKEVLAISYLLNKPENVATMWKAAQSDRLLDGQLAHCQGLFYLGQAYDMNLQDPETVKKNWRLAICHWAVAAADTSYWMKWGRNRYKVYGSSFVYTATENLGLKMQEFLASLLLENHNQLTKNGNIEYAKIMEQLHQELAIEFAAVRLSKALGGIILKPGRLGWFGPLWMDYYGLQDALAQYIATVVPDDTLINQRLGELSPIEALCRLRWYFSHLKTAAILLEGLAPDPKRMLESTSPNPKNTLKALNESVCKEIQDCGDSSCPLHGESPFPVVVCCPHWEQFAIHNPAYMGFESPWEQLCEDTLQLAIDAHLHLVYKQIQKGENIDRDVLRTEWRELILLAKFGQDPTSIYERLYEIVLEQTKFNPSNAMHPDALIALLEISMKELSKVEWSLKEETLKTRLALLLNQRAVIKYEQRDLSGAEADLKPALTYAPHSYVIRANLAKFWHELAVKVAHTDRFLALDYLRQAEELIEIGQTEYSGYDYRELLDLIQNLRKSLLGQKRRPPDDDQTVETGSTGSLWMPPPTDSEFIRLYGQGVRELHKNQYEKAIGTFEQALALAPDDIEVQSKIVEALMGNASKLIDQNKHKDALDLIKQWMPRLVTQKERLERQTQFLKWWPHLQSFLKAEKNFIYTIDDYQEVWLLFQQVQLRVEKDNLCLITKLPIIFGTETETILKNLLLASEEMLLFKVSFSGNVDLCLKGTIPFDLLEPEWFAWITFALSDFADVSRDQLVQVNKLRDRFREIGAVYAREIDTDDFVSASCVSIKKLCREKNLPFERLTGVRYNIAAGFGQIKLEASKEGVRLSTYLGRLRETPNRFNNLVALNTTLEVCKLALNENMGVVLSVEWPYLDEHAAFEAFELLERQVAELKQELARLIQL